MAAATELFLAEGYGATTIESVAAGAGVSKRTFYDRFDDKAALFAAVVHDIIGQIRPPPQVPLIAGANLEDILKRLARLILGAALAPQALALHRLVTAEAVRFPELARAMDADGSTQEAIALIGGVLERQLPAARRDAARRDFAAGQFLFMVVAQPQRRALGLGAPWSPEELGAWADSVVALFLEGCRGWFSVT